MNPFDFRLLHHFTLVTIL